MAAINYHIEVNDARRRMALEELLARSGCDWRANAADADVVYGGEPAGRLFFPATEAMENRKAWLGEAEKALGLFAAGGKSGAVLFEKRDGRIVCPFDLPAIAHGLLQRWEESTSDQRDEHGRWPLETSVLHRHGVYDIPVVDVLARAMAMALGISDEQPRWNGKSWAVALSFDIDSASMLRGKKALGNIKRLRREKGAMAALRLGAEAASINLGLKADPHENLDWLGDRLADLGVRSTFFVQADRAHQWDDYVLAQEPYLVHALRKLRERGHEIGLHGSYVTAERDAEFFRRQKRAVESLIGGEVTLHRHHYLRTKSVEMNSMFAAAGIVADCSVGFPKREGFRLGTCFPVRDEVSGINIIPVHVMDVTLRYHRQLGTEAAFEAAKKIMEAARSVGGLCVLLWHPHNLEPRLWSGWEEMPFELVRWAKENEAHVDSIGRLTT